jgi:hypothetical protein
MDIKKISNEIEKIQTPLIFLFRLISYKDSINDNDFSIILRLFLKHHMIISLEFNLKKLFQNELNNMKLSREVLTDYYKIIKKKTSLLFLIKKWQNVYSNKKFWSYNHMIQIDELINMKTIFNSIYDCSKGGLPFHFKIANTIDNFDTRDTIKERLKLILQLVGKNLFNSLDIILISSNDFDNLENKNIIQYLLIIYERINNILDETIKIFNSYNIYHTKLINLINPINITIKSIIMDDDYIPNNNLEAPLCIKNTS